MSLLGKQVEAKNALILHVVFTKQNGLISYLEAIQYFSKLVSYAFLEPHRLQS